MLYNYISFHINVKLGFTAQIIAVLHTLALINQDTLEKRGLRNLGIKELENP
jgi:hypothetical protein